MGKEIGANSDEKNSLYEKVGLTIGKAFFDDYALREAIRPIYHLLSKRSQILLKNKDYQACNHAADTFNSYIVSSYHAASAAEQLFEAANTLMPQDRFGAANFIQIQHAFGLEAVVHLHLAKSYLIRKDVSTFLKLKQHATEVSFDRFFPKLKDARDSLVHQDDRALALVHDKPIAGKEKDVQFVGQSGARFFGLKDRNLNEFVFSFTPKLYIELLIDLQKSMEES